MIFELTTVSSDVLSDRKPVRRRSSHRIESNNTRDVVGCIRVGMHRRSDPRRQQSFQVKNTDLDDVSGLRAVRVILGKAWWSIEFRTAGLHDFQSGGDHSSSGLDQAREGRLVDALAVRGDEGRDTLR